MSWQAHYKRVEVSGKMVLELMASGMTPEEILGDYHDLQKEDILACLEYAAKLTQVNSIYRIAV